MIAPLHDLIAFLETSSLAEAIREDDLLFPLIESVHVLAICFVVGSISIVDLRLLGFASTHQPVGRLIKGVLPYTWGAFAIAVVAGSLLFISHAAKYLENGFFVTKLALIAAAGLNMLLFHLIGAKNMQRWENDVRPPFQARFAGTMSLLIWISVVACGRWVGFTMQAD
jgi:hypothetical protein